VTLISVRLHQKRSKVKLLTHSKWSLKWLRFKILKTIRKLWKEVKSPKLNKKFLIKIQSWHLLLTQNKSRPNLLSLLFIKQLQDLQFRMKASWMEILQSRELFPKGTRALLRSKMIREDYLQALLHLIAH
jgi:hypothetical protein